MEQKTDVSNTVPGPLGTGPLLMQQASDLLAALVYDDEVPREQLALIGASCAKPYALIVVSHTAYRSHSEAASLVEALRNAPIDNIATTINNHIAVLAAYSDALRIIDVISDFSKTRKATNVISLPFEDVSVIHQQYELALYCLSNAGASRIVDAGDWVLPFLKKSILDKIDFVGLAHPALAKLSRYDELNQTNLLQTLKVYLEHDRNAQRCANVLYLHRNSLQYRVRRIQEIAGVDLDNPTERSYLRLSLFLNE